MRPLLQILADRQPYALRDLRAQLADQFKLTAEERERMLPSGGFTLFGDRVSWARYYLHRAGMLQPTRRSVYAISDSGLKLLKDVAGPINTSHLRQRSPEFDAWVGGTKGERQRNGAAEPTPEQPETPEEQIAAAHLNLRRAVESDLLTRLKSCSPAFFEQVVVRLLVAMGYGGSLRDAGTAIGRSGDEGIDGTIKEDRLGLDVVYVQAKRWAGTVGRPELQKFAGALQGQRARKGVFITTSSFTTDAHAYVAHIDSKVVLIDGEQLAQFMFEHNVGVSPATAYEVKKLDADFFDED